jgi:prepilin-type processing-associated H-X9-DG protein
MSDPDPKPGMTGYQVVVGADTAFPPDFRPVRVADVTDGASNTLAVGETRRAVPWTKPEDVPEAGVAASRGMGALLGPHDGGSNMLFLDGSVRYVKETVAPTVLGALLTRARAQVISGDSYDGPSESEGLATHVTPGAVREYKAREAGIGAAPTVAVPNTEDYNHVVDNPFLRVRDEPLSTFSVDVDTSGLALPSTSCAGKLDILTALENLHAWGVDEWRRRPPARLRHGRPELQQERQQPRHPLHRWRFQRRRDQQG